jgi:hypothetical protein
MPSFFIPLNRFSCAALNPLKALKGKIEIRLAPWNAQGMNPLLPIMSEDAQPAQPTIKTAKSMTGRLYEYPVRLIGEFLDHISKDYGVPVPCLRLLCPEEDEKDAPTCDPSQDMREDVTYLLFLDDTISPLLPWIDKEQLNPHLQMENPSYLPSEEDKESYARYHLDYCAFYEQYLDIVEKHLDQLSDKGWTRLFNNHGSYPLLARHMDLVEKHFQRNAGWVAYNPTMIPLLEHAFKEGWPVNGAPLFSLRLFSLHLSQNENAVPLLRHYPEHLHTGGLCSNPSPDAIELLKEKIHKDPTLLDRLNWSSLSANEAAISLLFEYPERVSHLAIYHQAHPDVIQWFRRYLPEHTVEGWENICKKTHPDFIAYVEEHLDQLPPSAWKQLSANSSAIRLLTQNPDKIHWGLLCNNPSPDVIAMIEQRLLVTDPPLVASSILVSNIGYSLTRFNHMENAQGQTAYDDTLKYTINCGSLSLHPHALPFLERHHEFIYWNSLSVHPGIYQRPSVDLL